LELELVNPTEEMLRESQLKKQQVEPQVVHVPVMLFFLSEMVWTQRSMLQLAQLYNQVDP